MHDMWLSLLCSSAVPTVCTESLINKSQIQQEAEVKVSRNRKRSSHLNQSRTGGVISIAQHNKFTLTHKQTHAIEFLCKTSKVGRGLRKKGSGDDKDKTSSTGPQLIQLVRGPVDEQQDRKERQEKSRRTATATADQLAISTAHSRDISVSEAIYTSLSPKTESKTTQEYRLFFDSLVGQFPSLLLESHQHQTQQQSCSLNHYWSSESELSHSSGHAADQLSSAAHPHQLRTRSLRSTCTSSSVSTSSSSSHVSSHSTSPLDETLQSRDSHSSQHIEKEAALSSGPHSLQRGTWRSRTCGPSIRIDHVSGSHVSGHRRGGAAERQRKYSLTVEGEPGHLLCRLCSPSRDHYLAGEIGDLEQEHSSAALSGGESSESLADSDSSCGLAAELSRRCTLHVSADSLLLQTGIGKNASKGTRGRSGPTPDAPSPSGADVRRASVGGLSAGPSPLPSDGGERPSTSRDAYQAPVASKTRPRERDSSAAEKDASSVPASPTEKSASKSKTLASSAAGPSSAGPQLLSPPPVSHGGRGAGATSSLGVAKDDALRKITSSISSDQIYTLASAERHHAAFSASRVRKFFTTKSSASKMAASRLVGGADGGESPLPSGDDLLANIPLAGLQTSASAIDVTREPSTGGTRGDSLKAAKSKGRKGSVVSFVSSTASHTSSRIARFLRRTHSAGYPKTDPIPPHALFLSKGKKRVDGDEESKGDGDGTGAGEGEAGLEGSSSSGTHAEREKRGRKHAP